MLVEGRATVVGGSLDDVVGAAIDVGGPVIVGEVLDALQDATIRSAETNAALDMSRRRPCDDVPYPTPGTLTRPSTRAESTPACVGRCDDGP